MPIAVEDWGAMVVGSCVLGMGLRACGSLDNLSSEENCAGTEPKVEC